MRSFLATLILLWSFAALSQETKPGTAARFFVTIASHIAKEASVKHELGHPHEPGFERFGLFAGTKHHPDVFYYSAYSATEEYLIPSWLNYGPQYLDYLCSEEPEWPIADGVFAKWRLNVIKFENFRDGTPLLIDYRETGEEIITNMIYARSLLDQFPAWQKGVELMYLAYKQDSTSLFVTLPAEVIALIALRKMPVYEFEESHLQMFQDLYGDGVKRN